LQREGERKAAEATAVRRRHAELHDLLAGLSQSDADLKERHAESQATHRRLLTERDTLAARLATSRSRLETLREGRSGLRARAEVLEGWEASREGFGAGVREVLARIDAGDPLLSGAVVGLVGDLVRAPREVAALVDVALGDAAQRLVVAAEADAAALADALATVTGRVGFLPLSDTAASPPPPHGTGPPPLPLSALVQCDRPGLAAQLLGNTFVVGTLADALAHAARQPWCRFVTPRGELLDADGSVTVGPALAGVGILSRKSELRELRGQLAALEATIAGGEGTHRGLTESADKLAANIDSLERELNALSGEAGTLRERIAEQRQVEQQLAERLELLAEEGVTGAAERTRAEATAERLRAEAEAAAGAVRAVNARLEAFVADHAAAEAEREGRVADHAAARVAVGQLTEQVSAARRRATELDAERRQRKVDGVNLAAEARALTAKRLDALLSVLRATQDAATHFADKEARERLCRDLAARRDAVEAARSALVTALKDSQSVARGHQDEAHRRELAVRDLLNERDGVTGKLRDDFGVDLRGLADSGAEPGQLPADPAAEIDALRKSVARLGAVNVESIAELAALEARETELRSQFDDLSNGRTALQAIIDQINGDSRRLFADLLTAVRGHFQELFRKVFAGGRADIVLDDEADVLESGIEIVAHPPGKQAQNLSLLSGGERALTAAALLLAIFRSKPSPFCLLDEIDAAMDEANTARLADLVREFSTRTQFIVITHKKRTMAAADVLHGVTMQESGVSKLVAVRFEDWPEDSDEAPRRAA
jgi:chromosome segregation protein